MPTSPELTFLLIHGGGSTAAFSDRVVDAITYLRAALDRAVPLALQDEMIGRLPGSPDVVTWDCGHIPAVTRPDELVALLEG
jgi:pimeloyl-ACP methyl ester carboxylesterase